MKILVTGFAPFGNDILNPSYEAVKLLPEQIAGAEIIKKELPVVFQKGGEAAIEAIREMKPDAVVLVGQAGGRTAITPERVAINCEDCRPDFPDNAGNAPGDAKIVEDGPDAYFSTLPIRKIVNKLNENEIPASISNTAGTYVCNDVMYLVMHMLYKEFPQVHGGFIHVPFATMQNHPAQPSMPLSEIARGLELAIEVVAENL